MSGEALGGRRVCAFPVCHPASNVGGWVASLLRRAIPFLGGRRHSRDDLRRHQASEGVRPPVSSSLDKRSPAAGVDFSLHRRADIDLASEGLVGFSNCLPEHRDGSLALMRDRIERGMGLPRSLTDKLIRVIEQRVARQKIE